VDRSEAWRLLHEPETDAVTLATIAAEHPEFAEKIAAHPHCYEALALWAGSAVVGAKSAEVQTEAPPQEAHGSGRRRQGMVIATAVLVGLLAVGGGVWALAAVNAGAGTDRSGWMSVGSPTTSTAPVLDGPPVYVGDELTWLLPDDTELRSLFPGIGTITRGAELSGIGETEGVHPVPEDCWVWYWGDDWAVTGIRTASWSAGDVSVRGFPTPAEAEAFFASHRDTIGICADFAVADSTGTEFSRVTVEPLAVAAEIVDLIAVHRVEPGEYGDDSLQLLSLTGNTVSQVRVAWKETFRDVSTLAGLMAATRDEAAAELVERIGIR
tara:strand:+ start:2136 stop:3110 length:975 start_codon:yes stop_codon:yes gene_type:complete